MQCQILYGPVGGEGARGTGRYPIACGTLGGSGRPGAVRPRRTGGCRGRRRRRCGLGQMHSRRALRSSVAGCGSAVGGLRLAVGGLRVAGCGLRTRRAGHGSGHGGRSGGGGRRGTGGRPGPRATARRRDRPGARTPQRPGAAHGAAAGAATGAGAAPGAGP